MTDFEARIRATGFDFAAVEALVQARRENPDLAVPEYIDARPQIYADRFAELAAKKGLEQSYFEELLSGYLGFVEQLDRAKTALGTP